MTVQRFPALDPGAIRGTREALHAYSRLLGDLLKAVRPRRKHWWHASLRPSLTGLTTGVVRAAQDFEVELDLLESAMRVRGVAGEHVERLHGQSIASSAAWLDDVLASSGIEGLPRRDDSSEAAFDGYSVTCTQQLQGAFASVAAALEDFRAGIREETSPIQVWPHHFDLSMLWLPGQRVAGQDPGNEEYADKQMNFGFVLGDAGIGEPYFYVTAYPLPQTLPRIDLPPGTTWSSVGFSGAVLRYADLCETADPAAYLADLWSRLHAAGREHWFVDE